MGAIAERSDTQSTETITARVYEFLAFVNKTRNGAPPFLLLDSNRAHARICRRWLQMPWKNPERIKARRTVTERFRAFVSSLMRQFITPPKELLNRAESELHGSPEAGDKSSEPNVR